MAQPRYPSLYQVNTRVWLTDLSQRLGRRATLDDVPDADLDQLAQMGFDWVWLLSVWQTGLAAQKVSRENPEWRKEFRNTLPDLREEDIAGSGFAITAYDVHRDLGGDAALERLRTRLQKRGLRLMLDFVPNHMALDHPWINDHAEYFVAGSEADLLREPKNYTSVKTASGDRVLAHGRDPYFPGWPDTLQLNYANPELQEAMIGVLMKIAGQCDGVRCDMAMLVLPEVFERTWGVRSQPFWPKATNKVRERHPEFCFMAEVYWDLEWTLQQQGFNYTYDKRLYDRLEHGPARPVCEHFHAELDYQSKLARFLENHDEPRAANAFSRDQHKAAAIISFLSPGLRFFHQGQLQGKKKRISPHLVRGPVEPTDQDIVQFYDRLLSILNHDVVRDGEWRLLKCDPAWDGNATWDNVIAFSWTSPSAEIWLIAVNYSAHPSQCYVRLPLPEFESHQWKLQDQLSDAAYDRDGNDLRSRGLYLDVPPWKAHVFRCVKRS